MQEWEARQNIVEIARRMYERDLIRASDGNLSIRLDENRILCTPEGLSKGFLKEEDLSMVDLLSGSPLKGTKGTRKPSSELPLHLEVYRQREEIKAVAHAHPPKCLALMISGGSLSEAITSEGVVSIGAVPIAQYATPSTQELAHSILPWIHQTDCILLDHHGALTVGETLESAYNKLETMEHHAQVLIWSRLLGKVRTLPEDEIQTLLELRTNRYGILGKVLDPRKSL